MFISFKKEDSIYKIFQTIEKLPSRKKVKIFIHSDNEFFTNIWWWKQLKEILDKKNVDYIFLCDTKKAEKYFSALWVICKPKKVYLRK